MFLGAIVGLFFIYAWRYFSLRISSRLWGPFPKLIPDNAYINSPIKIFSTIFLGPVIEEMLLRGSLLLIALMFGAKTIFVIGFLVVEVLIFGLGHITAPEDYFISTEWTAREKRKMRILGAINAIQSGLIYSFLTLFYLNLLPAILTHSAYNAQVAIRRIRYQNRKIKSCVDKELS